MRAGPIMFTSIRVDRRSKPLALFHLLSFSRLAHRVVLAAASEADRGRAALTHCW